VLSTSLTTALVAPTAQEKHHGPPIDFLTRNLSTTTAILPHPVVTPLQFIRTVRVISTKEKPSALAQCIVMRIAVSSVEASAFAVAVKTDTTTT
jgi:hypothetical protein